MERLYVVLHSIGTWCDRPRRHRNKKKRKNDAFAEPVQRACFDEADAASRAMTSVQKIIEKLVKWMILSAH